MDEFDISTLIGRTIVGAVAGAAILELDDGTRLIVAGVNRLDLNTSEIDASYVIERAA